MVIFRMCYLTLREIRRVCKPGTPIGLVVGNARYAGVRSAGRCANGRDWRASRAHVRKARGSPLQRKQRPTNGKVRSYTFPGNRCHVPETVATAVARCVHPFSVTWDGWRASRCKLAANTEKHPK